MKPAKGYYSVIQYCPDLSRLEAANIGVLLFCPERRYLKALTAKGNGRARHFFGSEGHDWSRLNSFKIALEERLQVDGGDIQTLDDLERFISLRANRIQMTPPRPVAVVDPEKDLERLFKELVGGGHRRERTHGFREYVADRLSTAGLDKKLRKDLLVTVPVLARKIEVPFGYQNGRFNLIKPTLFRSADPAQAENTAYRHAVQGRSLYESPDPELGPLQLLVLGDFGGGKEAESRATVRRILTENQVQLYTASEMDRLIDEIRTTAKDLPSEAGATS